MKTKTVYRLAAFIVSLAMAAVFLVGCTSTRQDAVTLYETDTLIDVSRCIQRLSDGKIPRVTSDGDDSATSASAGLNMR